jgi:uncharacterized repeat protein (TIGR02543 family)
VGRLFGGGGFEAPCIFVKENGMKRMMFLIGMLAMALVFGMAGCYFDLGEPRPEEQETQPKAGVLTVIGAEDGVSYEAEVYDYPDDDVADAADLAGLMRVFEMIGTGLDMPGEEALAIDLLMPDGEDFTADGDFLVVLKDETDASAPLMYKGAVPFTGGSATIEYDEMETAVRRYTVTFDLNYTDAPNPPKPQELDADGKATPPAVPVRTGYAFGGWFTDAAGTGAAWDFALNTVTTNLGLYAKWTRNTYKVTFDTGGVAPTPETLPAFPYDDTIEEPAITKTGYTLDGWYKDAAKTAKWDFGKDTVKGDITLYGTWTRNTYKVTFDTGGVAPVPAIQDVPYGDYAKSPADIKEGYTLGGWFTDAAGTGAEWDFDLNTVTENITLYGTWTQIKYSVTFNTAGGTPAIIIQSVPYGSAATKPANPTREGCDFDDWYTATDFAAKWNFGSIVTADITLFAKWKPITFAAVIADIGVDAALNSTSASYTLPSGSETYTAAITPLTTANSPASVTIDGGGRVITGSANRLTIGSGVTITLKNITFKTVPFTVAAGGTLVLDNGAVIRGNVATGIMVNGGTLEMKTGALVTENGISDVRNIGSGVRLEGTGSIFTMNGGEISGNKATGLNWFYDGGGVAIRSAGAVFTMNGGSIHDNTSGSYGGGILVGPDSNNCTLKLTGGEIYNNRGVGFDGGGIYIHSNLNATFNMSGGKIRNNTSLWGGSGVHIADSFTSFTMTGGEIYANTTTNDSFGDTGGVVGTVNGSPQIGGTTAPGAGKGWIHGNTPRDLYPTP